MMINIDDDTKIAEDFCANTSSNISGYAPDHPIAAVPFSKKKKVPTPQKSKQLGESQNEFREMNVRVPFAIPVSSRGKIAKNDAVKLLKHLYKNKDLKVKTEYFVTDSDGRETLWTFEKDTWGIYEYAFSCEITETPDGEPVDIYHCLYIDTRMHRMDLENPEWEVKKV